MGVKCTEIQDFSCAIIEPTGFLYPVFFFFVGWPAAHGAKKKTRPVFFLFGWPAAHVAKKTRPVFFFGWLARRARNKEENAPRRVFFLLVGPPRTEQKKNRAPCVFFVGWPAVHGAKKKRAPFFFLVGPPRTEQQKKRAPFFFVGRPAAHGTKKRDLQKSAPNKKKETLLPTKYTPATHLLRRKTDVGSVEGGYQGLKVT